MPILWRTLLLKFIKVFILCQCCLIGILLTTRFDEIAHFAALGPSPTKLITYVIFQIPFVFPITLPIATLVSSFLITKELSEAQELTALRALGLSLKEVLFPIVALLIFLSLLNFYFVSEVSTQTHLQTGLAKRELRSINPLHLVSHKQLAKLKGYFAETLGPSKAGEYAKDLLLLVPNQHPDGIKGIFASKIEVGESTFTLNNASFFTPHEQDSYFVENIQHSVTTSIDLGEIIHQKVWSLQMDHLKMPYLLLRLSSLQNEANEDNWTHRKIQTGIAELARRFSAALSVFSFGLLGLSCGLSIGRSRSWSPLLLLILLPVFSLAAFLTAKGISHSWKVATLFYILPGILIICFALHLSRKIARGIES